MPSGPLSLDSLQSPARLSSPRVNPAHCLLPRLCFLTFDLEISPALFYLHALILFKKLYVFFAVLGLCCCPQAFSRCSEQGLLSSCSAQASHCSGLFLGKRGLQGVGFSSCAARAQLPHDTWDLPGLEIEPVFPVLAGRLFVIGSSAMFPFFFMQLCIMCVIGIYLLKSICLGQVSVVPRRTFSHSMQNSQLWHVRSSSLTRDQTWAFCIGNVESQPLDHQRIPCPALLSIICILPAK